MDDDFPDWIQNAELDLGNEAMKQRDPKEDLIKNLQLQVHILTKELEKQDIWLMRAKRLIELYQYKMNDLYLNERGVSLIKEM